MATTLDPGTAPARLAHKLLSRNKLCAAMRAVGTMTKAEAEAEVKSRQSASKRNPFVGQRDGNGRAVKGVQAKLATFAV